MIAIAPLRRDNYAAIPLLALPSCKLDTADGQRHIVNCILGEWENNPQTTALGPIVIVATDGDAKRRLAFDQIFRISNPSSTISNMLVQLPLMDIANDVLVHFDDKHVIKRFREVLKSFSRGLVVCKVKITGAVHKTFLKKLNLPNIDQLLHPEDSQNVPLAVSLLKAVAQLSTFIGTLTPSEEVNAQASLENMWLQVTDQRGELVSIADRVYFSAAYKPVQTIPVTTRLYQLLFLMPPLHQASQQTQQDLNWSLSSLTAHLVYLL